LTSCESRIREWHRLLNDRLSFRVHIDEDILAKIKRNGCMCLCKFRVECPCVESIEEIVNYGRCKCGLFYTEKKETATRGLRLQLLRKAI